MTIASTTPLTFDATTTWNGSEFDWTQSYTVPAGADVLLLRLAGTVTTPTTVKYNGVALTQRIKQTDGSSDAVQIYDIDSPTTGANDLVINTGANARVYRAIVSTVSDVDSGTPRGTALSDSGFKATLSTALTTTSTALCFDVISIIDTQTASQTGGQTVESSAEVSNVNHICYSSKEAATTTTTTMSWSVTGSDWVAQAAISYNQAVVGPTLTGPDTTTVDAVRVAAGTALDTATTAGLKTVGYSKSLTIDSQTTTTLNQTDSIDAGIALGTPVASLPVEADVLAAGSTAWQIQQWVDDGVNPEVARNITLNYLAAHTTVHAMIATSNTTVGESFLATNIIAVEDEMQATGPNVVDTVTITYNADGTITTDKDQTIAFNMRYWSPSTGQASLASVTVRNSTFLSGTGITRALTRSLTRSLTRAI